METGVQLGGLYKKATHLNQYRKNHPGLVIVDSGDLLNEEEELPGSVIESAKLKAELILEAYKTIGIDAVNVGELDLALGLDFLKELEKKHSFPFVSANLVDADDKPVFERYVLKKVNGKTVAIMGLYGDTSEMAGKLADITGGKLNVQDPVKAAEAVVAELAGKADYVIALTHQIANRDWVIARRVKGIHLVVGGHDKLKTPDPQAAGDALIVRAGEKGQYLGMLEVALDGSKEPANTLVPLGDEIADDARIKEMIAAYNDKVAEMYGGSAEERAAAADVPLRVEACAPCHSSQVAQWKTTDHAKAYATLVGRSKQYDPKCLSCHTIRFEQPNGFNMKDQQMALVNVQCESCHGDATEHLASMKPIPVADPQIDLCLKCHTDDRCPEFEADKAIVFDKIRH